SLHTWYPLLRKPSFTPPNWLFPVAWTILYVMMGWAWASVVSQEIPKANKLMLSAIFGLQLLLNFLWSFFFFYLQSPLLALIDLSLLWVALGFTILVFCSYSRLAAALLVPYWAWVSFAWMLNFQIWMLNKG
ncbi:MAG: tryptophan-rich sensory protein, partial [Parachlamydia sp.]|nr:tryptophan-rich sensory protein [Parachlamydia sp.]